MNKHKKRIACFLLSLCAFALLLHPSASAYSDDTGAHELIVLFDNSTSMAWNDTAFLAPDALRQLVHSLPSHWHLGLVTFRSDVVALVPPGPDTRAEISGILDGTIYTNWTNAGAGLRQALELFSDNAQNRTIVFMTDGEMAMLSTPNATAEAVALAESTIAQISASDIQVHTIVVGDGFYRAHEAILGLAETTGGHLFQDIPSEDLSEVISTLAFDVLEIPQSQAGLAQLGDAAGNFTVRLPVTGLDSARVLITTESAIEHIVVNGNGSNVSIQVGQRFAIVEVLDPLDPVIHIEFLARGVSSASLIMEWDLELMATLYTGRGMRFWLADSAGENVLLNPFFHNGTESSLPVKDGHLHLSSELEKALHALQVHLEAFGINLRSPIEVPAIPQPPTPPTEEVDEASEEEAFTDTPAEELLPIELGPSRRFAWVILIMICLGLAVSLVLFRIRSRQKSEKESSPSMSTQEPDRRFEFTGKLDLYVTTTSPDTGESVQTPYMYRLSKRKRISLAAILRKCHIPDNFPSSDHIYLTMDKWSSLQISNDSNDTVFIGTNILTKTQSHTLSYLERVRVCSENPAQELVISPRFLYRPQKH